MTPDSRLVASLVAVTVLLAVGSLVAISTVAGPALLGGEEDYTLVVATEEGETVLEAPADLGDTVVLEYTHSVEKTPVRDVYAVTEDGIVMTRMEFQSYGAGLPSTADVEIENGTFIYEPPGTEPGPLYVATGSVAGHDLVVAGTRYDLVERADGGTVVIRIEPS